MIPTSTPPGAKDGERSLLDVRDLSVRFPGDGEEVRAVNDVSFSVQPGRILGVVGESGSGKSVTAKAVMRMLRSPGRVDRGEVLLDGDDVLQRSQQEMQSIRGRQIAMIFQDPQAALNPVMRIGAQITEALEVHGMKGGEARTRAKELLAQVGIPDVDRTIDQYPHEFSGGMRQRVVIAIALANRPSVLIADEPTTALDVTIQAQILELLRELRDRFGVSIVMITHDMGVVAELCDELVVMYGGRVVERGTVREVFANPRHPYTHALLNAVPRLGGGDDQLQAIAGSPPDPAHLPTGCSFHPRCPVSEDRCRTIRPPLAPFTPTQAAACLVTADGGPVAPPESERSTAPVRTAQVQHQPILSVENLRVDVRPRSRRLFGSHHPIWAVDGVSLTVRPGETLGLVGESGCGKSTLSRSIVGIRRPTEGRVVVDGHDVTNMGTGDRRRISSQIQYVFQDPYASLNPRRTIGQSMEEALAVAGVDGGTARRRAVELIERVGLNAAHLGRYPFAFSGGQRQRIGIARALAANPKMLILDEPVSALDVSIQAQIINLLAQLRDDLGLGYLFIAHDLAVVRHLSDRVAVMYLGRIVETGPAAEVYSNPQHPYTAALLSSTPVPDLPDPTGSRSRERIMLVGDMPSPAKPPSGCRFRTRCPIGPLFKEGRERCIRESPALEPKNGASAAACHFAGELAEAGVAR